MRPDWVKRVNTLVDSGEVGKTLSNAVLSFKGKETTELEMLMETLNFYSNVIVEDRAIPIPNFSKETTKEIIAAVVADFKNENANGRFVKPIDLATVDDIVVLPLGPRIFHNADTYAEAAVVAGNRNHIPLDAEIGVPGAYGVGSVTGTGRFVINPDNVRIVITDLIDVLGAGNISRIQYLVDDEQKLPMDVFNYTKAGNMGLIPLPSVEVVRINFDLNAEVEFLGDTDLIPVGVCIIKGENMPNL